MANNTKYVISSKETNSGLLTAVVIDERQYHPEEQQEGLHGEDDVGKYTLANQFGLDIIANRTLVAVRKFALGEGFIASARIDTPVTKKIPYRDIQEILERLQKSKSNYFSDAEESRLREMLKSKNSSAVTTP